MAHVYGLDEAATPIATTAAELARTTIALHAADVDARGRFPEESIAALARAGLLGVCVPAALGGLGQGPPAFAAVAEEPAQACASTAMVTVMHVAATQAVAASTTLADRDPLLAEIARGRHLTTLALSERGSRSHFWAPVSRMEVREGGWVTSAAKSWVTSAAHADSYVASGQRPGAASPLESTLYLLRRGAPGARAGSGFDGLGLRGNESAPLDLEQVRLAPGDLLTAQGAGAPMMLDVILPGFAIGTAAMANGLCRAAVDATAAHLRGQGFAHTGTLLRDLPNLRARLAAMSVRTEQSRALLGQALAALAVGAEGASLVVLQARLAALEAAVDVTDLAMKTCGGAAFSKHLALERFFRDARAGWVMAPTVDHLHDFVGRALTGLPLF